jgi:hypothetical protein
VKKSVAVLRFEFSVLTFCALAKGFQQGVASDSQREKDVYAIYSLMLTRPQTSHGPDDNERYLIAAMTAPPRPREPCVRPPEEREAEFKEMQTEYERRKAVPRELKPAFSISKPYALLSRDEAQTFIQSRMPEPGHGAQPEEFKGVTDLFTLSDVYFNRRGTLALTGISTFCGGLCGLFQWKAFEKLDTGEWEERRWTTCTAMARYIRQFREDAPDPLSR